MNAERWLVHTYSPGAGDVIQYSRYLPLLVADGINVTLSCDVALHRLLQRLPVQLVADSADAYDRVVVSPFVLPLLVAERRGTIPQRFTPHVTDIRAWGLYADDIPPPTPLWVDPNKPWFGVDHLHIGVCWAAAAAARSLNLANLLDAVSGPGIVVSSLQVGPHAVAGDHFGLPAIPAGSDWATSAAYVRMCDLVVTADTGLAHLAASLGVPTWMVFGEYRDVQWGGPLTTTTPWYAAMRLFTSMYALRCALRSLHHAA